MSYEITEEQDYTDATTEARQAALEELDITISATKVSHELSKTGIRFKWNVVVSYNGKSETFDYSNGDSITPIKTVYDREQFERFNLANCTKEENSYSCRCPMVFGFGLRSL